MVPLCRSEHIQFPRRRSLSKPTLINIVEVVFHMARLTPIERKQAPWHLRWFYTAMKKMVGKELTPAKMQMRLPGLIWGSVAMEAGLGRKRRVSLRLVQLAKVRTAARVGCPF